MKGDGTNVCFVFKHVKLCPTGSRLNAEKSNMIVNIRHSSSFSFFMKLFEEPTCGSFNLTTKFNCGKFSEVRKMLCGCMGFRQGSCGLVKSGLLNMAISKF